MKNKVLVLLFTLNFFFASGQENNESILGKWRIDLDIEKILDENINKLESYEKMVASLSSGLIIEILNVLDLFIMF